MITQIYYIGTGAKSAMFTLRMTRRSDDAFANMFVPDNYLCNLAAATDEETGDGAERAIEKARAYVETMRERIGETDDFKIEFGGIWEDACNVRRGKLSVRDTHNMEIIEAGKFPFGKHAGKRIDEVDGGYVCFFADKIATANEPVAYALAAACMAVAMQQGHIVARDAARAERARLDALSVHFGTEKERVTITGEIVSYYVNEPTTAYDNGYTRTTVRTTDGNLVDWYNNDMGARGDLITFKATIKAHNKYKGIKTTRVNRPKLIEA